MMYSPVPAGSPIVVGMSGGVDSAVAALLLQRQGFDVQGVFMQNWEDDDDGQCTARQDYRDAAAVCDSLKIPLHSVNFSAEYWDRVFAHFLSEYQAGRTPNPDILCNREIKFAAFLDYAESLGAAAIATGHYARLDRPNEQTRLLRGLDPNKDQTYFLHQLSQSQIARAIFPIGEWQKAHVRQMAADAGLHVHEKKDSTGICFIGERRFQDFLSRYLPANPGDISDLDGNHLGRHNGLMYYTLGQRRGLGIGGTSDRPELAWFVAAKDLVNNQLIVVQGHDHPALLRDHLHVEQLNWCSGTAVTEPLTCTAKIRYRQQDVACTLTPTGAGQAQVTFDQPQRAVTPGQSAVFYLGEQCLGGGVICDHPESSGDLNANQPPV